MVFVHILLVISFFTFIMFKVYDITRKNKNGEELTSIENLISNFGIGLIKILLFLLKSIIGFVIPVMLIFLPSVLMLVIISASISKDYVPYAVIVAGIISITMYLYIVLVIKVERRKVKKAEEKRKN